MESALTLTELAVAFLAGFGVLIIFVGATAFVRWQQVDQRLRVHVQHALPERPAAPPVPQGQGAGDRLASGLNRRLARSSWGTSLQLHLTRAGLTLKPPEFVLLQGAAACVAALIGRATAPGGPLGRVLTMAILAVAGFAGPYLFVQFRERQRLTQFDRQLPQAIDSMAGTLQAGSTLPQAMDTIAREMLPPLSVEFRRVLREMELGLSFSEALVNLGRRMPTADLLLLTSAIAIQNRVGGDLSEMLRSISHTIRERLRIRSEINVLTAQGRYSSYLISGLPVVLFVYLYFTRYDYASQLFLPGITRALLVMGIAGIVVGYYAMRRIITVDV